MWKLERDPLLRSTIVAAAVLDGAPSWDDVTARVTSAVDAIPRMRERVHESRSPFRSSWVEDPSFDLGYHLRRVAAPAPGDLEAVLTMAEAWAAGGFDPTRPLWELTLVEGLQDGTAVLVQKLHHAVTDGIGGLRLALHLFDLAPEEVQAPATQPEAPAPPAPGLSLSPAGLGRVLRSAGSAAKLLAPTGPPLSTLMTGRGRRWHYARLDRPLAGLRAAGHAAGGTVNDAFLAGVTGGLRRYHEAHGVPVDQLRALVPVSVRRDVDPVSSNQFAPVRFEVPVALADPMQRMRRIGRSSRAWQGEPALGITRTVAALLDRMPPEAAARSFGLLLSGVDFVATNVEGFPFAVYLGGRRVTRYYGFAPTMRAAVNVALLSHEGTACVGSTIDTQAIPDVEQFQTCLAAGFDEVLDAVPAEASTSREAVTA